MKTLEGKVAVITGGSSGIGLATAKLFQQVGARVAISGRNQKSLDDAVKELGAGVVAVRSDVSKLGDLDTLFAVVTKKLGRIDVLFANAGIAKFAPVAESRRPPTTRHSTSTLRGVLHHSEGHTVPEWQCINRSEYFVRYDPAGGRRFVFLT